MLKKYLGGVSSKKEAVKKNYSWEMEQGGANKGRQ